MKNKFIIGKHYFHVSQSDSNFNHLYINEIVVDSINNIDSIHGAIGFNNIEGDFYSYFSLKNAICWIFETNNDAIDEIIRIKKEIIFGHECQIKIINKEIIELTKSKN